MYRKPIKRADEVKQNSEKALPKWRGQELDVRLLLSSPEPSYGTSFALQSRTPLAWLRCGDETYALNCYTHGVFVLRRSRDYIGENYYVPTGTTLNCYCTAVFSFLPIRELPRSTLENMCRATETQRP